MKTFNYLTLYACILLNIAFFTSCDNGKEQPEAGLLGKGILAVNQGGMNNNDASLTYIDYLTNEVTNDLFYKSNQRRLGDTGQDILAYGTKIYITLTGSATIEVADRYSCESVTTLISKNGDEPRKPRNLLGYNGNIYVSYWDGHVARIDTTTLEVEQLVETGRNPEQMAIANGKLYVTNSGGMSVLDNTVSVIDLTTFREERKIDVESNPTKIAADNSGNLYVVSMGEDFGYMGSLLQKIDANGTVTSVEEGTFAHLASYGNRLYAISFNFQTNEVEYITYNTLTGEKESEPFLKAGDDLPPNPCGITVNPQNGDILIGSYISATDYTSNGYIYHFNSNGELLDKYNAGLAPGAFTFLN